RATAVSNEIDQSKARINELGQDDLDALRGAVTTYERSLTEHQEQLATAQAELSKKRAEAESALKVRAEIDALIEKRKDARERLDNLDAQVTSIETRISLNADLLKEADEIEAAVARSAELDKQIYDLETKLAELAIPKGDQA